MAKGKAKGVLVAAVIWLMIAAVLAVAFKYLIYPKLKGKLQRETGSESRYKHEITLALDSFSGYCVLRSDVFNRLLKDKGIKLTIIDDKADYEERIKSLQKDKVQIAVFTLDSLIKTGAMIGEFPATVVMLIDETKGADAIVAYKSAVSSLEDLNTPEARIVMTPNSPSELLARIVIAHFSLPNLPEKWWVEADGASDVYKRFKTAKASEKRAYALWEPYVSKALDEKDAHVLLDSSKIKGYIVDVLVVQREFLRKNPEVVNEFVEDYFRAAFAYFQEKDMVKLVMKDAEETGSEHLNMNQAEKIIQGIQWKNTLENYAHFGILSEQESQGLQNLEDMIINITDVLIKTGAIEQNPLEGKASTLFYDKTLRNLRAENFHPSRKLNILKDESFEPSVKDEIRGEGELPKLSDKEWERLVTVGTMKVKPITFARGTSRLNIQSQRDLDELAKHLDAWPYYYLLVVGHSRAEGDVEMNIELAKNRAEVATQYLISKGISENRIKAKAAEPSASGASSQSVMFTLVQQPY